MSIYQKVNESRVGLTCVTIVKLLRNLQGASMLYRKRAIGWVNAELFWRRNSTPPTAPQCLKKISMENQNLTEITQSRAVLEMLMVANEYCLFVEKAEDQTQEQIVSFFLRIAPLLYLRGNLLPEIESDEDFIADRYVAEEQWEEIFKGLRSVFGSSDLYYALNETNDTVQASLADNLADIYQDMKDFVMVFQKNTHTARINAISQVRILFTERWGTLLLQAMLACHKLSLQETRAAYGDFE